MNFLMNLSFRKLVNSFHKIYYTNALPLAHFRQTPNFLRSNHPNQSMKTFQSHYYGEQLALLHALLDLIQR